MRELLASRDLKELVLWNARDPNVTRTIFSFLLETEDLLRWRAIEALGALAAVKSQAYQAGVRDYIRRLSWAMNDESGNAAWHALEKISGLTGDETLFSAYDFSSGKMIELSVGAVARAALKG